MNVMPDWMKRHVQRGVTATVNFERSRCLSEDEADALIRRHIDKNELVAIYATPVVMTMVCSKILCILRDAMIRSKVVDDSARKGDRVADLIAKSDKSIEVELKRLKDAGAEDLEEWIGCCYDAFMEQKAMVILETWRNVFSAMLLKRKMANVNDNLREFCCYALVARAIGHEIKACCDAMKVALDTAMKGSGRHFSFHSNNLYANAIAASNALCDRFGLMSFEETMEDLNVRRCQEEWVRAVGSMMVAIKDAVG